MNRPVKRLKNVTTWSYHSTRTHVTGEWYKAPNGSGNFGNLFKPTFKGVDKIMNFQEGIPTAFQKKENKTPFMAKSQESRSTGLME